jgi:preprotein translocase subunit YajC
MQAGALLARSFLDLAKFDYYRSLCRCVCGVCVISARAYEYKGCAVRSRSRFFGDAYMNSILFLQANAAAGPSTMAFFVSNIAPLLMIFVVFYFLLIRPQQKKAKEHQAQINAVQKNDEVVTGGGLMGRVTKVTDEYVEVEIAKGVSVKAIKSTLTHVKSRNVKPAND